MKFYELAKRVANFAWENGDQYEIMDCYGSLVTFGDFVSETMIGLCNEISRKGIYKWLMECETEIEEAHRLAREVASL